MWNLTKDGFLSVVAYDPKKDREKNSPFPGIAKQAGTHLLVRARRSEHLEPLRVIVPGLITVDDKHADYRFRCVIKREQYKQFLCWEVDNIDYWSHFKEAMRDAQPEHLKQPMYRAAMSTWGTFASLQASAPYKGTERPSAPAHRSAGEYQESRGVKPFRSAQNLAQTSLDDVLAALPDVVRSEPAKQVAVVPSTGELSIDDVTALIEEQSGGLRFSSTEMARMDDDAFELINVLHEKYGTTVRVNKDLVRKHRDEIAGTRTGA